MAAAHDAIADGSHFLNGLLHPVMVPAHLLLLITLGLMLGQRGIRPNRLALLLGSFASLSGLAISIIYNIGDVEVFLLAGAVLFGLLVATRLPLDLYLCSVAATWTGLLVGLDSQQALLTGIDKWLALTGSFIGFSIIVSLPMCLAAKLGKQLWQQISVRVVGSWLAASAFLVFALSFSQK